jgi:hypothetical protein
MNIFPLLLLGILVFPDAHACVLHPSPQSSATVASASSSATASATVASAPATASAALECDACMFLANEMNQTVLHNPKVTTLVADNLEKMCALLPPSVQTLCSTAANQTAPVLLNHLGDLIATEGCADVGVCRNSHSHS